MMTRKLSGSYKWLVVGMLWLVCFFNYADRQAIFSVFPLIGREFSLSDVQLGVIGSSFMWMYALFGPVAGWVCDRLPRKTLILAALLFWSVVTGATAFAHSYWQLILCRALGGLGEAFYFPASMSLISDYHRDTRSRAMSIHQSSVYAGTIAGGAVSGFVGQYYGWQSSFVLFGALGVLLALSLGTLLREPERGMSEPASDEALLTPAQADPYTESRPGLFDALKELFANRVVLLLIFVFMCANFVAVVFLAWMPTFLYQKFHMSLSAAGFSATAYLQVASVVGVLSGGFLADAAVKRGGKRKRGGRVFIQALALLCGAPFLFLTGWAISTLVLIVALIGFGFFKGMYDANIFASLHDVVRVERRGVAVGIMNSLAWLGGGMAPIAMAVAAGHYGMSAGISATAGIYLLIGLLMLWAAMRMGRDREAGPDPI
ncbi:MAG: MFS transporter [Terracidiphilus sp.]|jgi:MFS family permease